MTLAANRALPILLAAFACLAAPASARDAAPLTIDAHIDIGTDFDTDDAPATAAGKTQFDLAQARRGGLDAAALAIFVPQQAETTETLAEARAVAEKKYAIIAGLARRYPAAAGLARSPAELRSIVTSGRFAIVEGVVNGGAFVDDVADLDRWAARGVSFFGFVHAGHNRLADSSRPALVRGESAARHGGLSPLGRDAVARLNRLGVVIDISQLSDAAADQVLALSTAPVIASHSDVRALVDVGRNLTDAQLDRLKANHGVIALNAFSAYLRPHDAAIEAQLAALRTEFGLDDGKAVLPADRAADYDKRYHDIRATEPKADLDALIAAIDHVVRRIGIDHVALSSDFNHGGGVTGWQSVADTSNVIAALRAHGYSAADIDKIWSGNLLRVWQVAIDQGAKLRAQGGKP